MKKENKGITLIALVITIIVLLILAGVAIATLTGENGILTKANEAKTKTTEAGAYEQVEVAVAGSMGTDGQLNYTDLEKNLKNIDGIDESKIPSPIEQSDFTLTVTVNGTDIEIKDTGEVKLAFNAERWDKTAADEDCFYWKSDEEGEEGYNTIIGYTEKINNYTKLRFPSRCKEITFQDYGVYKDNVNISESRAFTNNIEKVEIPGTTTIIGSDAFGGPNKDSFQKLKMVDIETGMTSIERAAFYSCTSLTNITIPNSVRSIGDTAFNSCTSLTNITIPNSVTSIGSYAFTGCTSLINITIPNSVTSIGSFAFSSCTSLTNIIIPNSITSIESWAFSACTSLTNITIPNSVRSIGDNAFSSCTSLTDITILDSVKNIDDTAFGNKYYPISDTAVFNVVRNSYADTWLQEHKYGSQTINYINE